MVKKQRAKRRTAKPQSIVSDELFIPNHSGMLDAGKVHRTPTDDLDPVNKKYVDNQNLWQNVASVLSPKVDSAVTLNIPNGELLKINLAGAHAARTSQVLIEGNVTSSGSQTPLVRINQLSSSGNRKVFEVTRGATKLLSVDNEGDADFLGQLSFGGESAFLSTTFNSDYLTLISNKNLGFAFMTINSNPARGRVAMGHGNQAQEPITSDKDWDDVLIRRDVDGAHAINGNLQKFEKDVTSATSGNVNYANYDDKLFINTDAEPEGLKFKITTLGGYAIKLTNKTGNNSVAGQLVAVYSATAVDDAVKTSALDDDGVIGITLDAGVSDGSEAWYVVSGIADVLMDDGGSARGDRIISSGNAGFAGSADVWNVGGAVATHFQEIGHCIETRTGAGLARCVLHFN